MNISDESCRGNKTHILCSVIFFRKLWFLWDNVEKYGTAGHATDDSKIRRMSFACGITKATDTHSEYVILIAFQRKQWLTRTRFNITFMRTLPVLLSVYCCVFLTSVSLITNYIFDRIPWVTLRLLCWSKKYFTEPCWKSDIVIYPVPCQSNSNPNIFLFITKFFQYFALF